MPRKAKQIYRKLTRFMLAMLIVWSGISNLGAPKIAQAAVQQWLDVGAAGFSAGGVNYTSIAIDSSGTPYVVFEDRGNSNKATVMKFNGSSWVPVGDT